jgi:hypothetical protein
MAEATTVVVVLVMLVLKGAAILGLTYIGARLAIRHERRAISN